MKIVINTRENGSFGLSPTALQMYARRKGKDCYFFTHTAHAPAKLISLTLEEAEKTATWWFA